MKTLEAMTKDERSLLLFFETRAVDHAGKVQTLHINDEDYEIADRWNKEGFIAFGRIAREDCDRYGTHWCQLSEEAWSLAHAERRIRAGNLWNKRGWQTAEEKRLTI